MAIPKLKNALKDARKERGWSQQTLGFHAGIAAADISKMENGWLIPYPGQAERLAKVLGLRVDELFEQPTRETQPA
jgi:ribosome-binding protein aMBF1 (putative translation factor)